MDPQVPAFVAHTPGESGSWHSLTDHLIGVSERAGVFAGCFGAGAIGALCGLWHDIGKADPRFREYLIAAHEGRPANSPGMGHSAAGALLARERHLDLIPSVIAGHHSGLPSVPELKETLAMAQQDPGSLAALAAGSELEKIEFNGTMDDLVPDWIGKPSSTPTDLRSELLTRMVFSTLIDADRLDTAQHFSPSVESHRATGPSMTALLDRLRARRSALLSPRSNDPVADLRSSIRDQVVEKLRSATPGVFTLTSPTGSGKTLTVLEGALEHAVQCGLSRVVMAVPFTSVTEQVANVYRQLVDVDGDAVLEHHSAMASTSEGQTPSEVRRRLSTENWDASLVVTTTVRLLESLFSNRPSDCRRLHRLANAVIIVDETQSVPLQLIDPSIRMLTQLAEDYGSTVILMTATQPPFRALPAMREVAPPVELLELDSIQAAAFHRCAIEVMPGEPSWDEVASAVQSSVNDTNGQGLVVVNTIADAEKLFERMKYVEGVEFLSTRLCSAHRRDTLARVSERLDNGSPVVVISTQLIEAGIDIDFPVAYRAVAPVTSIAQVAGRVNRHGLQGRTASLVVFDPMGGGCPPGEYATGVSITRSLLQEGVDLLSNEARMLYFERIYGALAVKLTERGIDRLRARHDFPEVAVRFRLIENDTESVIVPYGQLDVERLAIVQVERFGRSVAEALQPYTVSLRRGIYDKALTDGLLDSPPGLPIPLWVGGYDDWTGLMLHDGSKAEIW